MRAADDLAALAAEYRAMSPRARRAVLKLLDADEAETLERLATDQAEETPSPWLAARLAEARAGTGPLTPAVRQALLGDAPAPEAPRQRGPSLAGRVGAMLGTPR